MSESVFLRHESCPSCGSRDNLARYSDGHAHCFGCGHYERGEGAIDTKPRPRMSNDLLDRGRFEALPKRRLTEDTLRHWDYSLGDGVHIAAYKDAAGNTVAQKVRRPDKTFSWYGVKNNALPLYGQWLWKPGGKRIVVTEGEIDALSVSQMQGHKWPVVSVPDGAQGAVKAVRKAVEYLESFDTVVFMFDNDEIGRPAAEACAAVLSPGKAAIATLPLKDPSDMLQAGRGDEIIRAAWEAQPWRPDGVHLATDLIVEAATPIERGLPWPWPELDALLYGRRPTEVYTIGAGTGVGKTDFLTQLIAYTAVDLREPVGVLFLEQPKRETVLRIAGKAVGERLHVPDPKRTQADLEAKLEVLRKGAPILIYDHFGSLDFETIVSRIRYMAVAQGAKHVFLDHLTALAAAADDERKSLEHAMSVLASMAQELNITLYVVSHLATPDGTPHEEGGRVAIRHFKGSRAIGFWSHVMLGLERDQQSDDEEERATTTVRILKERLTGDGVGRTVRLRYDRNTGLLHEADTGAF
ncbi:MAG: toprim domain-containing protein [Armatimonadetes bacterium]|nr:toprim domain-containing protein [Armatimonadota bacterium]MCA1995702.1 toprim domain-containing protein [Armatimonadota bacterium]